MILEFLIVLSAVSTKPGDAVNLLYERVGHAFLPATQRPTVWDFTKARRDETTLTNHAQNRWDVVLPRKGGFGRALTVPVDDLFPGEPSSFVDPAHLRLRCRTSGGFDRAVNSPPSRRC